MLVWALVGALVVALVVLVLVLVLVLVVERQEDQERLPLMHVQAPPPISKKSLHLHNLSR